MARISRAAGRIGLVFIMAGSASMAAAQGRLGGGGDVDISLTRILVALLLCVMIATFAILYLKRSGGRIDLASLRRIVGRLPIAPRITVIETRRISAHADICLVRCDQHEYLILSSAQQQQVLRSAPLADAAEP